MPLFLLYAACAFASGFALRLVDPIVLPVAAHYGVTPATAALRATPPPEGYVSPVLTSGEEPETDNEGLPPHFAISARFGQLTPVPLQVGVVDEAGQRFTINLETPAENSYAYEGETCPA